MGNVTWRGESEMQPHYSLSIIGTGPPTPSPLCLADISDISIFGDTHLRHGASLIMKESTASLAQVVSENVLLNLSI